MPQTLIKRLQTSLPQAQISETPGVFGPVVVLARGQDLPAACKLLKTIFNFDVLEDETAVDLGGHFQIVLHLICSQAPDQKLTVKAPATDEVPSLTGLYGIANWYEREIFDLFGLRFSGHPDLRRILLPEDWKGHPLRKDYSDDKILKRSGGAA